jgi:hypothetical protein
MEPKEILEQTRQMIREHAGDDPDRWWYANRFVYARLQGDEKKTKVGIKKALIAAKQPCHACGEAFESTKGIHLHRMDGSRGYTDDNCVLMHGPCHQKWHADHPEETERPGAVSDPSPCLTKVSGRHEKNFIYWWDIAPNLAKTLAVKYEEVEFKCDDTHARCIVPVKELLPFLTPERQTSRSGGKWGIKIRKDRPDDLAFEPPTGSDDWLYMPVTWLEEENED